MVSYLWTNVKVNYEIITKVKIRIIQNKKQKILQLKEKRSKKKKKKTDYKIPIINLLNYQLNEKECDQVKMELNHSFINKDENENMTKYDHVFIMYQCLTMSLLMLFVSVVFR